MIIPLNLRNFSVFDALRAFVFFHAFPREDFYVNDDTADPLRCPQRRIFHIARFFAENRPQKLFFRRKMGFPFRRNLADENVTGSNFRADAHDAAFIKIAQGVFADVRNVARDFFAPKLGVAGFDFAFFDVNRGEHVVFDDILAHQNRVFKIIPAPRHERDQHVPA